eukprot:gene32678-37738_t
MVGSVGGIIGGLAKGDASPDSMKQLIHDLEAPLVGMATGFSCSLFGLFSSLMLGLLGRFLATGVHAVKNEFEAWLAGISQIETETDEKSHEGKGNVAGSAEGIAMSASLLRSGNVLGEAATGLRRVVERQDLHTELLQRTCALLDRASQLDSTAMAALERTEGLRAEVLAMREDMMRLAESVDHTVQELEAMKNRCYTLSSNYHRCETCHDLLLGKQFYLFPCSHGFHCDCLIQQAPRILSPAQYQAFAVLADAMKTLTSGRGKEFDHRTRMQVENIQAEMDNYVAADCPLCGYAMIQ